jgi:hypothetical protein
MSPLEGPRSRLERCWFCHERILPDDPTRVLPGYDLTVHARCYKAATEPAATSDPTAA